MNNHCQQLRNSQNRGGELKPISVCAETDNGSPADSPCKRIVYAIFPAERCFLVRDAFGGDEE